MIGRTRARCPARKEPLAAIARAFTRRWISAKTFSITPNSRASFRAVFSWPGVLMPLRRSIE